MKKVLATLVCASMMVSMVACGGKNEANSSGGEDTGSKNLVVYCPHPLEFIDPIVAEFEDETGIQVDVVAAGTGELLKRIESEKDNPLGDVMWGGSLGTLQPKVDYFEEYTSANEGDILDDCKNTDGKITRFSNIPSVLMINTNLIGDIKVEGYEDLLNPELKGKIAHADPSKSSSSFEHLVNMLYAMGNGDPEKGWDYADKLAGNLDGKLLSGSSAVYKGVADGEYTVGLTFEEGGAKYVKDGAPVKIVYMKEGVISKPDGVAIIKGAKNMDNAKKFIDFLTSKETQTMVASELSRRSVRKDVDPAEGLKAMSDINIIEDDSEVVKENKQVWIDKFKEIFTNK
ncbi:ABC transporter substrate-binding protein [Clostridium nigeriense]|uniref:ABC transporter substrate-binding protein n=1 Tax=Clostridium nigeriense TaxID=1805470 RepID=UPI00082B5CCC|nr:ABC transporter substrate-binding protein [Clostridium nigeriense]